MNDNSKNDVVNEMKKRINSLISDHRPKKVMLYECESIEDWFASNLMKFWIKTSLIARHVMIVLIISPLSYVVMQRELPLDATFLNLFLLIMFVVGISWGWFFGYLEDRFGRLKLRNIGTFLMPKFKWFIQFNTATGNREFPAF